MGFHRLRRVSADDNDEYYVLTMATSGTGTRHLHMEIVSSVSWLCIMRWYEEGTQAGEGKPRADSP